MKSSIISRIIVLAVAVLTPQITQSQGSVTYISNLGQPSTGSLAVGSDSWLAVGIYTGNNIGGYDLNSIQLAMTDASSNPSGFSVMLYNAIISYATDPGSSLGSLGGSGDPSTADTYTYTPISSLTLLPSTYYFIVLTAGTTVASGAYEWSLAGTESYNSSGGWAVINGFGQASYWQSSSQGSSWTINGGNIQFSLDATPIPEPDVLSLFALGSFVLGWNFFRKGR